MSNKLSLKPALLSVVITLILGFLAIIYFPSNINATDNVTNCLTSSVNDTFDSSNLNSSFWDLRTSNGGTAVVNNGKVDLNIPSGVKQDAEGGITTKSRLCGDFDIKIDYSNFQSELGKNTGEITFFVANYDDGGKDNNVYINRLRNGDSPDKDGFSTNTVVAGQGSPTDNSQWKSVDNNNTAGKLRIKRIGTTVYTYYDQGFGWQLQRSATYNAILPFFVGIRVGSWVNHPQVSASIDNFSFSPNPTIEALDNKCSSPFNESFSGSLGALYKNWNRTINSAQSQASIANNMLNASITNNALDWNSRGLWSTQYACGDFDISVDVSNFLADVKDLSTASFTIDAPYYANDQTLWKSFYVEVYQNKNERGIGTNLKTITNNQDAWFNWHGLSIIGNNARLRLKRTGNLLESFYNLGNGWIRLGAYSGFNEDAKFQFFINSRTPDKPNVSASFGNFNYTNLNTLANVTLKLKLQNITVKRSDVPVLVTITDQANQPVLSGTYNFVSDDNGIYTGTVNGILVGTYNIKLKPQTFLAKKFTGQNLATGNFTLEFTASHFLGGDIDGENNIVDIFDYNRMISDFGAKMPSTGSPADLDKNGQVDIFDYNDLIGNFGKTGDN